MKSPYRAQILKLLDKSNMSATQVAEKIGSTRERTYNVLIKMARSGAVSMEKHGTATIWTKYKDPPPKPSSPARVTNSSSKAPLTDLGFTYPSRPGSMDAYAIRSKFHHLKGNP